MRPRTVIFFSGDRLGLPFPLGVLHAPDARVFRAVSRRQLAPILPDDSADVLTLGYLNARYQTGTHSQTDEVITQAARETLDTQSIEKAYWKTDELTAALDSDNAQQVMELLLDQCTHGTALIVATHDPAIAAMCQTRLYMRDGQLSENNATFTRLQTLKI